MTERNCNGRYSCLDFSVLASIVIGIITAVLSFTAVITAAAPFLWVVFGIAVVYLAILLFSALRMCTVCRCARGALSAILIGILGTILTSIILLGIGFAATSIIGAIIFGALLFFFSLVVTATVCLIRNAVKCED